MQLTLALAQMDILVGQPDRNLELASTLALEAAQQGCDLLLLPELWSSGYDLSRWPQFATSLGEGMFKEMSRLASQHRIWIGGSLLEKDAGKAYNTFVLFNPNGSLEASYRKIHLFRLMDEHLWLTPGDHPVVLDLPWGRTALTTCYDLRFPDLFTACALDGATFFLLCAEWPERRIVHWDSLLRARAIENQAFVVAVNRSGRDTGESFGGRSAVIGPWGDEIAVAGQEQTILVCEIDLNEVEDARRRIPVFNDRRPDVYR